MKTLFKDIQEVILSVQMVENVPLQMLLTITGTDITPMSIKHPQVQQVWLDELDTVPVLLVTPPALDTGVPDHGDINVGHDVTSPQGRVLINLHVDPGVPGAQGVKLFGLSGSFLALDSIEKCVLVDRC